MTEEVQAKKYFSNKVLLIVLGVLILVIIGLIIGVVVVNMNGGREVATIVQGSADVEQSEKRDPAERTEAQKQVEDEMNIITKLNQDIDEMETVEEKQAYLDQKVEEYSGESVLPRIIITKAWVYIHDNQAENALTVLEEINEDELTEDQKLDYYSVMMNAYQQLDDAESVQKYQSQWDALYVEMFEEIDGGGYSF